ncbi:hypothetical protein JTE90_007877 [Oedothorax gibbosus]|uniref:Secreted protein n=1 Tax=Oedothorax gibbosus TaxID=931172 RepID=A0AAV6VKC0_9ARAC|nr:hypothetical protein JTE90_007877 [Oedothorax gibbosus]
MNVLRHYGGLWKHILYASIAILIPFIRVPKPAPVKCEDISLSLLSLYKSLSSGSSHHARGSSVTSILHPQESL